MIRLDPEALFERLARDVPAGLHEHVFVVGSLAAAYHFRVALERQGVNTKDADLVVYPAGDTSFCSAMAEELLDLGWRPHPDCYPMSSPKPAEALRAIRLYPSHSTDYFVEFLNLPEIGQAEAKRWVSVMVRGGWYGLPTFKFQGLCACGRLTSEQGLAYASPAMMALANLLSHPFVRVERMSAPSGNARSCAPPRILAACLPSRTSPRAKRWRPGSIPGWAGSRRASRKGGRSWPTWRAPASANSSHRMRSSTKPGTPASSGFCAGAE